MRWLKDTWKTYDKFWNEPEGSGLDCAMNQKDTWETYDKLMISFARGQSNNEHLKRSRSICQNHPC
jgi:hypothetical protein